MKVALIQAPVWWTVDAPLGQVLRHYRDKGCKGVGEIMPNVPMRDPMVQNLFKHAEAAGLPVTFDGSDQVGGDFRVLGITRDQVILERGGETLVLQLPRKGD